jgi:hypothetical protein
MVCSLGSSFVEVDLLLEVFAAGYQLLREVLEENGGGRRRRRRRKRRSREERQWSDKCQRQDRF